MTFHSVLSVIVIILTFLGYIPYIEGCMSFPGVKKVTLRKAIIDLEYQTQDGEKRGLQKI